MKLILVIFSFLFLSVVRVEKRELTIQTKEKTHYFIFEEPLKKEVSLEQIKYSYSYRSKDPVYPKDSMWNSFELNHNLERDTFYLKSKLVLDSIEYFNATFFDDNKRVGKFFEKRFDSNPDTLEIYVIEKISDSDSLIFRKVNRFVMPYL